MQFVESFTNGAQSSVVAALEYCYLRLECNNLNILALSASLPQSLSLFLSVSLCPCRVLLRFRCLA